MNKSTNRIPFLDEEGNYKIPKVPKELKPAINWKNELMGIISICSLLILLFLCIMLRNQALFYLISYIILTYILIFVLIPSIWIYTKIGLRTKNNSFIWELLINIQFTFLLFIVCLWLGNIFNDDLSVGIYLQLLYWIGTFFIIFQKSLIKRKPVIWEKKTISISNAPIVSIHSIEIKEELDGYSQRPISSHFQLLKDLILSSTDFKNQLNNYCEFLGKQGELIDWNIEDSYAILYPRFVIGFPNVLNNPLFYFNILKKIRAKKDLTSIEISFSPPQVSINIAHQDYNMLNRETTFHILCFSILKSVKQSLTAFLNNDINTAHQILGGGRVNEKSFIQDMVVFDLFSSSRAFLAKIYTTVLKRKKKRIERSNKERIIDEQRNE